MTTQTITLTIDGITITITTAAPAEVVAAAPAFVAAATTRTPVVSSVIASVGYNVVHRTLEIEFRSGDVYQYDNVPAHVYDELIDTRSAGQYFSYYIRDKYTTRKITR